jgi:hypothetical protein
VLVAASTISSRGSWLVTTSSLLSKTAHAVAACAASATPLLSSPPFVAPFSHSLTSDVTSSSRNSFAWLTAIPEANGVAASVGREEAFSVDSLHALVTG